MRLKPNDIYATPSGLLFIVLAEDQDGVFTARNLHDPRPNPPLFHFDRLGKLYPFLNIPGPDPLLNDLVKQVGSLKVVSDESDTLELFESYITNSGTMYFIDQNPVPGIYSGTTLYKPNLRHFWHSDGTAVATEIELDDRFVLHTADLIVKRREQILPLSQSDPIPARVIQPDITVEREHLYRTRSGEIIYITELHKEKEAIPWAKGSFLCRWDDDHSGVSYLFKLDGRPLTEESPTIALQLLEDLGPIKPIRTWSPLKVASFYQGEDQQIYYIEDRREFSIMLGYQMHSDRLEYWYKDGTPILKSSTRLTCEVENPVGSIPIATTPSKEEEAPEDPVKEVGRHITDLSDAVQTLNRVAKDFGLRADLTFKFDITFKSSE